MKYQELDDDQCWCSEELIYKPCSKFLYSKMEDDYHTVCRSCEMKIKKKTQRQSEAEIANLLLQKIGYIPKSDITIHQQFKTKHNL